MLIRVEEIKDEGLSLEFEEAPESFPALADIASGGEGELLAPVTTRLRAVRIGGMVEVDGSVSSLVRLSCGRCLQGFDFPLEAAFSLTFVEELPAVTDEVTDEEVEVDAEEMGLILFEGEEIDLRDAIQEQLVMALPLRPLCRKECKGLCSQCGADLNEGACGCGPSDLSLKFAALKDFKVEKKG